MIEDYVTYEQAKKLKELGFDWKCSHYYECNRLTSRCEDISGDGGYADYTISVEDLMYSANKNCPNIDVFDAPTLWQAQEWIRRTKNIHVIVNPSFRKGKILYTPYIASYNWGRHCEGNFPVEYNKALSSGITQCLKILEDDANNII